MLFATATSGRSFGPGRWSAPSRSAPSRGQGFVSGRGLAGPVPSSVGGAPVGSRMGAANTNDDLGTDSLMFRLATAG